MKTLIKIIFTILLAIISISTWAQINPPPPLCNPPQFPCCPTPGACGPSCPPCEAVPFNGGLWILLIAGALMGIYFIKKNKLVNITPH